MMPRKSLATPLLPARVPLNYVSLFSGIGGFDIGFDRAGMRCKVQVEHDEKARAVLTTHWKNVTHLEDVKHVGKHNLPPVDLICGGSPCQDISIAGKRAGLVGKQSRLFFEFVRILDELKPTWFVFENVDNLLRSNSGRDFATVLIQLGKCGYRIAWRVFDAQYFGVAQRRRRLFLVGHSRNGSAAHVLYETDTELFQAIPRRLVSPTLIAEGPVDNGGGAWTHGLAIWTGKQYRRLTPTECERLQGFPDGWTAVNGQSDSARYKQLGNAVCVNVAEWLGRRIVQVDAGIA